MGSTGKGTGRNGVWDLLIRSYRSKIIRESNELDKLGRPQDPNQKFEEEKGKGSKKPKRSSKTRKSKALVQSNFQPINNEEQF